MDNGYLDSSFNVSVKDLLADLGKKDLIKLQDTATVGEAIELMDKTGVSQLPVFEGDILKGLVTEKNLLKPCLLGELSKEDGISLAYTSNYKEIDHNELLSKVADSLLGKEIVFVTDKEKVINVLTEIDILHYINEKGNL